ncbi:MAG: hypothetical protein LVQ63_08160 [Thermoplasmatales archaeon]|nr:hypothetical protein [Thermoplasmatales archaeon]
MKFINGSRIRSQIGCSQISVNDRNVVFSIAALVSIFAVVHGVGIVGFKNRTILQF